MSNTQQERIQQELAGILANLTRPKSVCLPGCDLTATELVIVNKMCPNCLERTPLYGTAQQFHNYHCQRGLVQVIFPEFSIDQAETISSGICGPCWDKMFAINEEDD